MAQTAYTLNAAEIEAVRVHAAKLAKHYATNSGQPHRARAHDEVNNAALSVIDGLDDSQDELFAALDDVWADYSYAISHACEQSVVGLAA